MIGARGRIVVVAGVLLVALGVVLVHLANLMLVQHETWLERSCRNRWAFRDVPPRRGAILDRTGVVLVQDDPGWSLWLDPARFLQAHPLGLACSLHAALGLEPATEPEAVMHAVLSTRMDVLDDPALGAERRKLARDLALALVRSLLPRTLSIAERTKIASAFRAALGSGRILLEMVPEGHRAEASKLLTTRLAGFRSLREKLRAVGANDPVNLLAELARKEKKLQVPQRRLAKRIPYELVVDLTLERELWPGLVCLPSVERKRGLPGREGLLSLETLIGRARLYQGPDDEEAPGADEAEVSAGQALANLTDLDLASDDEGEAVADLASRQAHIALIAYYKRTARFGNSGVEKLCNAELEGTPGLRWTEQNSRADERRLFASFDVLPGRDVKLTIDARIQSALESTLDRFEVPQGGECGFTLIDADSGDILALGGRPLKDAEGRPWWTTPAVAWKGPGDLGSVAKPFVLIENYESERLGLPCRKAGEFGPCKGTYDVGPSSGRKLKCDLDHGALGQDPIEALSRSCNSWFFQSGAGLGAEGLKRAFVRAGLLPLLPDSGPGLRFQSEIAGIDPVHFGIIMVFNLFIGALTPPIGNLAFIAAMVAKVPPSAVFRALWPYFAALIAALLVITFVPALSLWLPHVLRH